MYQFSDSDTTNSDDGIRFKTASTRANETEENVPRKRSRSKSPMGSRDEARYRSRSRSRSPKRYSNSNCSHLRRQIRDITRERRRSISLERLRKDKIPGISKGNKDSPIIQNNDLTIKNSFLCDIVQKKKAASSKDVRGSSLPPTKTTQKVIVKDNKIDIAASADSAHLLKFSEFGEEEENEGGKFYKLCGPALPPHLIKSNQCAGPSLPLHFFKSSEKDDDKICGPSLPPHLIKSNKCVSDINKDELSEEYVQVCGPTLPPHLLIKKSSLVLPVEDNSPKEERSIGPFIPELLRKQLAEQSSIEYDKIDLSEDDDGCYGPLPPEIQQTSRAYLALEERALQIKLEQLNPQTQDEPGREEWMIELPTVHAANLGLGPRQFRAKAGPDMSDRSSWTETPDDKKKKIKTNKAMDLQKEAEISAMRKRDEEQEAMVKKEKKKNKRDKSLLEHHQEKLNAKKKADKEKGVAVRRPFNRETDLKVNHFDEAQKKSMMKKAALLDDRFSHGQTKYL